jgi:hypothetical protein
MESWGWSRSPASVELVEPLNRYDLGADRAMGHARLGITVPITAAGPQQAQLERNIREPGPKIRVVAGVPGLHRVQALSLEPLDEGAGSPLLQVRDRHQAAGRVHQLGNDAELGQRLFHEGGPAPADVAVERVAEIRGAAVPDDGAGHVGPPDRTTGRLVEYAFEREVHPQPLEVLDHLPGSPHPIGPAANQEGFQLGRHRRQEVPQHVHLAPRSRRRELASSDHPNPVSLAGGKGFRKPGEGVVIGQRNGTQAGRDGTPDHTFGSEAPVRGGRMHMQIDGFHRVGRPVRGAQRRYPISGAVQDGWEWASSSRNS